MSPVAVALGPAAGLLGPGCCIKAVGGAASSCASTALLTLPTAAGLTAGGHDSAHGCGFRSGRLFRHGQADRGERMKAAAFRYLEVTGVKSRRKRRRRSDDSGDDGSGDDGFGGGSFGGFGGGSWNGGHGDYSGYSGGDWFSSWARYEVGFFWHMLVAMSLLHTMGYHVVAALSNDVRRVSSQALRTANA